MNSPQPALAHLRLRIVHGTDDGIEVKKCLASFLRETILWKRTDEAWGAPWLTLEYPSRMYFWDFDLYLGVPLGVPKIDAALDAYEKDLRTDRLREKVIGLFE